MARSDKRYAIYPAPRAVEVLGPSCPMLNQAIECWAALLTRAMAENSRTFKQADDPVKMMDPHMISTFKEEWQAMNEWSLLAVSLKDLHFDPEFANPGQLVATAVEDAHKLEYIGAKCFVRSIDPDSDINAEVEMVVKKLRDPQFDYVHAWAVIVAVQWFWEHQEQGIDVEKDPWWTLAFRRQWSEKATAKKSVQRRRKHGS